MFENNNFKLNNSNISNTIFRYIDILYLDTIDSLEIILEIA